VIGLILGAAPMLATATLLGGVDPALPVGSVLVCLACGVFGCTLALTLSVWGRKPHEVLLATYAFGIGWLLSAPIWLALSPMLPGWARPGWLPGYLGLFPYNPIFLVLAPLGGTPMVGPIGLGAQARFGALGLLTSALLAAAATWRIREVVIRQAGRGEAPRKAGRRSLLSRMLPSPSLDANPVLWREWHRRRPSGWSVAIWGLFGAVSTGFSLWAILDAVGVLGPGGGEMGAVIAGLQVSAGLLLLSVPAATSLAEERQRGSLDVLMTTPLSTRSIVLGKWWGSFRGVPPLAIGPVLIASALATRSGFAPGPVLIGALIVAYGAAITSLGLALATWLPRMGRAVGLTAGLYLAVLIGAVPLAMMLFGDGAGEAGPGLASASPMWGVGFSSALFGGVATSRHSVGEQAAWVAFWTGVYVLVASGLLLATLATFDRCLGRMGPGRRPFTRRLFAASPNPPSPGDSAAGPGPRPPRA
jgi:hypothetical protein